MNKNAGRLVHIRTALALAIAGFAPTLRATGPSPEERLTTVIQSALPAFVFIAHDQGNGSGVLISKDGYIITNFHVVQEKANMHVRTGTGASFFANVVGRHRAGDLALLKIESDNALPFVPLADSDRLRVGQLCVAIGNPAALGLFDQTPTITTGVVSGLNQFKAGGIYNNAIVTDAPINPGNSGGPLLDMNGKLIGINGLTETRLGLRSNTGLGYAIPSNQIALWLPLLKAPHRVDVYRGRFLGVAFETEKEQKPDVGVLIRHVAADSDAEKAGLKAGDLILRVQGLDVWNLVRFAGILNMLPSGTSMRLEGERDGKPFSIETVLAEKRPAVTGFTLEKPDKNDEPIVVQKVQKNSAAAQAGLRAGDVLIAVAKHPLTGPALLQYALLTQRWMPSLVAGMEIDLEVRRKSGEDTEDIRIQFLAD